MIKRRSDDGGETWEINRGILEHPTREHWLPGAGGMCCHSIQLDPGNPQRMYVAITSAGAFRSDDGGESWIAVNKNVAAVISEIVRIRRIAFMDISPTVARHDSAENGSPANHR